MGKNCVFQVIRRAAGPECISNDDFTTRNGGTAKMLPNLFFDPFSGGIHDVFAGTGALYQLGTDDQLDGFQ